MSSGIWVGFLIGGVLWAVLSGKRKPRPEELVVSMNPHADRRECVWCDRKIDPPGISCSTLDDADLYWLSSEHPDPLCRETLVDLEYTREAAIARGILRHDPSKDDQTE